MREYETMAADAPSIELCMREQADSLTGLGHELHSLIDSLEDRLFEPMPREVSKGQTAGNAPAQSVSSNLQQTRRLAEHGLNRLRSILARV